jgi:Kef-type K+ transport system membrane component KefB
MSDLAVLLAALAVLLGLARICGTVAVRLGQPAVVGEIACGILVGAALSTGPAFPAAVDTPLSAFAQLGLALFLFTIGARLAPAMTGRGYPLVPALGAAVVPFALGAVLALWLADRHAPAGTPVFVLFVAAAMTVTAFPVLARILAERGMLDEPVGQRALSAAAVIDAGAWTVLVFVTAALHDGTRVWSLVLALPMLLVLLGIGRPWFGRWVAGLSRPAATTLGFGLACAGAAATDAIGLHAAIGAFLLGYAVGRSAPRTDLAALVAPHSTVLVPLYFVLVGRSVDLGDLDLALIAETAAIVVVGVVGKCGGAYLGARLAGTSRRSAAEFAVLMNTRGVTELVFVSIGLGLGVIDGAVYTAMVVMALVTTAMTGPLLNRLRQPSEVA